MSKVFMLRVWRHDQSEPVRPGFTTASSETISTLRIGSMVIGWELTED